MLILGTGVLCDDALASSQGAKIQQLQRDVTALRIRLSDAQDAESSQTSSFSADATAITVASGLGVLIVTLGGVVVAVMGYRFIRAQVQAQLDARIDNAIRSHGTEIFEREAGQLRNEYDAKLAEVYSQARGLTNE